MARQLLGGKHPRQDVYHNFLSEFYCSVIRGCGHIATKFDFWFQVGEGVLESRLSRAESRDSCDSGAVLISGGQKM